MKAWTGASLLVVLLFLGLGTSAWSEGQSFSFGVILHRNPATTAEFWNPIVKYVSERSGVPLTLKVAKTGPEHTMMVRRAEVDFLYSNHNFVAENAASGYRVFARPRGDAGQGEIVVLAESSIRSLAELQGKEVAFPHAAAFLGYHLPMDAMLRAGIQVKPLFAGNQEAAMGQLKAGRTVAAGVSAEVMRAFARRENVAYRVLWSSEKYLNLALSAGPAVPEDKVKAVREAFLRMADNLEGVKVLASSAAVVKQPPISFVAAADDEFNNMRQFYRTTRVKIDLN